MATLLDIVKKGSTDRGVTIRCIQSSTGSAPGDPKTDVVYNSSGIDLWYRRQGAAKTSITEATLSALTDAHSDGGFLHIGDGEYRLDLPDAAFATGAQWVDVGGTVTNGIFVGGRVRLVDTDWEVANIPANVTQFGGSNGTFSGGRPEVNTTHWGGTAVASAVVKADLETIKTQTVTCAAGVTVLASVGTAATSTAQTGDAYAIVNSGTHGNAAINTKLGTPSDLGNGATIAFNLSDIHTDTAAIDAIAAKLSGLVMASEVIGSTGNSTTAVHLSTLTYGDGEINDHLLVIYDNSTGETHARWVSDWVNATKLATVATLPFTPENAVDTYYLICVRQDVTGGSGPSAATIADAVWDELQADHVSAGSFGEIATEIAEILTDTGTTLQGELDGIQADTEDIQSRLPAALVNSRMDCTIDGTGMETGAVDAILNRDASASTTNSTLGAIINDLENGGRTDLILDDILADTAVIGAAGAGLSAIPWNATWDAEVQSEVEDGLVTHRLDELLNADSDIDGAAPPTVGSVFHELMSKTAGSFTFDQTTDSLEAVRDKLTDIETDTAEIGAAGAGLTEAGGTGDQYTAIPWNASWDTEVQSECTDALNAYDPPTKAETDALLTTAMTESYATDGSTMTVAQALYLILANVSEFAISGTTLTAKKLDGSTTAATYTLDDATNPTSRTRAS